MAIYTKVLVLTDTSEEAKEINAPYEGHRRQLRDVFATQYGRVLNSVRYEELEYRYTGPLQNAYENYVATHKTTLRRKEGEQYRN